MRKIKTVTIIIFIALMLLPIVTFNFQKNAVSAIDNRVLTELNFKDSGLGVKTVIENYVNDRIGLRDKFIYYFTVLNDKLFNKMVHPTYVYGEEGYVFGAGLNVGIVPLTDYHRAFAEAVIQLEDYCNKRDIPFLFAFEPAKPAVYSEYIAKGHNYDRTWVEDFFDILEDNNVNYLDNTVTLKEAKEKGEVVFNKKYDANHWNALGAYYGTNAILEKIKEEYPDLELNDIEEFTVTEKIETTLPVSEFPINESVPVISISSNYENVTSLYNNDVYRNPAYTAFGYFVNESAKNNGSPRVLVFQGSYMNGFGIQYMANACGEYIYVHDYQNVLDMPYYINIFQPDYVVFEVAEYTFSDGYFNLEKMQNLNLPPIFEDAQRNCTIGMDSVMNKNDIEIQQNESLTQITFKSPDTSEYAWLHLDEVYDMQRVEEGFMVTVKTDIYNRNKQKLKISVINNGMMTTYSR